MVIVILIIKLLLQPLDYNFTHLGFLIGTKINFCNIFTSIISVSLKNNLFS